MRETESGMRLQKNGRRIRWSTLDNYEYLYLLLKAYESQRAKKLRVRDWEGLSALSRHREIAYWKDFYHHFTEFLFKEKGHYDNYVGHTMKKMRSFFAWMRRELILDPGPYRDYFLKPEEDIPVMALDPQRLRFLMHDHAFEEKLPLHLKEWKDVFVFGCLTALRFSDLMRLNATNLEAVGQDLYLRVCSQKTQTVSRIWLPQQARDILQRFEGRTTTLFPTISIVNFNKAVKKIALLAGWTEEIDKTRNQRGIPVKLYRDKEKRLNYRFCDLVSSHTMRRTAITTMLRMGMNELSVRNVSGHTAHSPSFYRYVQHSESYMNEEIKKVFSKLEKAE